MGNRRIAATPVSCDNSVTKTKVQRLNRRVDEIDETLPPKLKFSELAKDK